LGILIFNVEIEFDILQEDVQQSGTGRGVLEVVKKKRNESMTNDEQQEEEDQQEAEEDLSSWPTDNEEEEEEPDAATLDAYIEVQGTWERGRSRSRRTVQEALEVRLRDWRAARWPHRMLEWIVGRLIRRALGRRPAPMLLGFALQPAGWATAYHIPLRYVSNTGLWL